MAKERLHYQKSSFEKIKEKVLNSFLIKSTVFKRTILFIFTLIYIFGLFFISNYQNNLAVGSPSPLTVKAQKSFQVLENDKKTEFKRGAVIASKGEIVTATQFKAIEAQHTKSDFQINKLVAGLLLSLICLLLLGAYLKYYHPPIYENFNLTTVVLVIIMVILSISLLSKPMSYYFTVVPAAGIAAASVFNPPVALIVSFICAILAGFMSTSIFEVIIIGLIGSVVAILAVAKSKERNLVIRTATVLSATLIVVNLTMSLLQKGNLSINFSNSFFGLASGLTSTVIAIGALPFLESMFGITTDYRLLELVQSKRPLLMKMMNKAPGTYSHSLNISNMVEAVAPLINADPLIAKAGGLYHDIGKISRPYFFTENQTKGENPHQNTRANLSYLIITAHVREGVEIAKKDNLPDEVINIIREHHGTTVVQYFYNQARKTGKNIRESDYRYHEVKPQTKEAALVMLADTVEAAARSFIKPSAQRLEEMVHKLVRQRIDDNQLNESHLSLSDIDIIQEKFTDFLINIYHPRIKYPGRVVPFVKKINDASTDK